MKHRSFIVAALNLLLHASDALVAFLKDSAGTIQIDYLSAAVVFSFVIFIGINIVTLILSCY